MHLPDSSYVRDPVKEQAFVDNAPPEIRALIHDFGYDVIATAIKVLSSNDGAQIRLFAEANRRRVQEKIEIECADADNERLRRGFGSLK